MNEHQVWNLFLETGAPELYLLYKKTKSTAKDRL